MQVREALLDAAYDAAVTTGWAVARMADVAAAAGVSRQTLYDQFGSRDGLAPELALREVGRFLDGTECAMAGHEGDVGKAIEAAVGFALTAAHGNPLVHAILTEDGEAGLLPYVTTRAAPVLDAARQRVLGYFDEHWPVPDRELAAEVAVRLTLSYIVLPGRGVVDDARRVAHLVTRVLDPRSVP